MFPLILEPGQQVTCYLYTKTPTSHFLSLNLWSVSRFAEISQKEQLVLGIFYGALILIALYNLFLWASVKDISYLFYVLYVVSYVIYQAGIDGLAFQYLWPEYTWWAEKSVLFFIGITILNASVFTMSFLALKSMHYLPVPIVS
jgi:hypothetical protein